MQNFNSDYLNQEQVVMKEILNKKHLEKEKALIMQGIGDKAPDSNLNKIRAKRNRSKIEVALEKKVC